MGTGAIPRSLDFLWKEILLENFSRREVRADIIVRNRCLEQVLNGIFGGIWEQIWKAEGAPAAIMSVERVLAHAVEARWWSIYCPRSTRGRGCRCMGRFKKRSKRSGGVR